MGFWPKLFFQNSCFFSNNSHRWCHRGPFIGRKECTLPYMVILPLTEATDVLHPIYVTYYYKETNFEKKVWMETQYGVKIFQNFHFQKHSPTIQKRWAKKKFKKLNCLYSPTFPILTHISHTHPHFTNSLKIDEFWKKVWLKTQYGVKNFHNFHFQKHPPTTLDTWVKKKSKFIYIKYNVYLGML